MTSATAWRRLALLLTVMSAAVSCGEPAQTPPPVEQLTFETGTSRPLSQALVRHYNEAMPSVKLSLSASFGGSFTVATDLHHGAAQIGIAQQADIVYAAYRHGLGEEDGAPYSNLRGIAVLWMNVLTVLAQSDGHYRTLTDLKGKRVGILPVGSATEYFSRVLLDAYGMTYSDIQPEFLVSSAIAEKLEQHALDATILVTPVLPDAIARHLEPNGLLKVLPISQPIIKELLRAHPFLHPVVTSSRQRPDLPDNVETVGIDALLMCRDDLSEEIVYQLTKGFFSALPALATEYAEAAGVDPGKAPATPIPLHPGAARYYREREVLK